MTSLAAVLMCLRFKYEPGRGLPVVNEDPCAPGAADGTDVSLAAQCFETIADLGGSGVKHPGEPGENKTKQTETGLDFLYFTSPWHQ